MATLVPRVRAGVDVRKLPLDPTDGFVLTRIDGVTPVHAIAQMTGLPEFSVSASVEKLKGLGAVDLIDPAAPPPNVPAPPPVASAPTDVTHKANASTAGRSQRYPEEELDEPDVDLERDHRRQVLDLFYDLDDLDHYTLLGLTREADKKSIKRAYYDLAAKLHPDRFFRKKLGSFKSKMEVVFARITSAHDTLTDKEAKADYDAYLGDVVNTRALEAQLARAQEEIRLAKEQVEAQARAAAEAAAAMVAERAPSPSTQDLELKARREALARRLGRPAVPPAPGSRPDVARAAPEVPSAARSRSVEENRDTLRRMYEDRLKAAQKAQSQKYADLGRAALSNNDPVAAANALRMAVSFEEGDSTLRELFEQTEARAASVLMETYLKAAQYEERSERFAEAARSWSKVSQLRPTDAVPADAAARCLLAAKGDLHEAARLAQHAISVAPQTTKYRVTLANVYLAANLVLAAKRELENAARIDPKSTVVSELLKRLPKPT